MPIEIRELIIKATVSQQEESSKASSTSASNNNVSGTEEIVSRCVERILEILKDKHER